MKIVLDARNEMVYYLKKKKKGTPEIETEIH